MFIHRKSYLIIFLLLISIISCEEDMTSPCDEHPNIIEIDKSIKVKRKVLIIGIDGFRSDAMQETITPFIDSISRENSVYYTPYHIVEEYTWSGPNWSSILNGVHINKHNVKDNSFNDHNYNTYPPFFAYIKEADNIFNTAAIVNWTPINNFILSEFVDYAPIEPMNDSIVFENAKKVLIDSSPIKPDIVFLHFDELDAAGHNYGFSPYIQEYKNTLKTLDLYVKNLFNIIKQKRIKGEDWMIFIVSDHGGEGNGHSDTKNTNVNRTIFLAQHPYMEFKKNHTSNQTDLAPTILDFLGISSSIFNCKTDGISILQ